MQYKMSAEGKELDGGTGYSQTGGGAPDSGYSMNGGTEEAGGYSMSGKAREEGGYDEANAKGKVEQGVYNQANK